MATPTPGKVVEDISVDDVPSPAVQDPEKEDTVEFVDPLPKDYECPLCLQVQKDPTLTSCCGHHFCQLCINRVITRDHICPLCKDHGFQTLINKSNARKINALKVHCKLKSQGCQWVGELGRLEHHLDVREGDCGFVEVECDFSPVGCVIKVLRKDIQVHRQEYVHKHLALMSVMSLKTANEFDRKLREQQTKFQQQLQQKDEQLAATLCQRFHEHKEEQFAVIGRLLHERDQQIQSLQRQEQQAKLQISTLQKKVKSQLQDKEKQIQALQDGQLQLQQQAREHLAILQRELQSALEEIGQLREKDQLQYRVETHQQFQKYGERLTKLEEERRREGKELEGRIQSEADERRHEFTKLQGELQKIGEQPNLQERDKQIKDLYEQMERRIHELEEDVYNIAPFEFTMTGFSEHKANNTEWFSPPFYSHPGGYKFCVGVWANGKLSGLDTHVSLTVCKICTDHDDQLKWPRSVPITIQLVNQETGNWEYERVDGNKFTQSRPSSKCDKSVSNFKFIERSKLGPYLKEDSLCFKIAKVELR